VVGEQAGLRMTAAAVDLSDFALWRNGFPDELFAELRCTRPLFRHDLTPGVAKTVQRDFWVTTKHRHAVRLHRDTESFTAADGPLIQPVAMFSSYPTIITLDPPALNKRRKLTMEVLDTLRDSLGDLVFEAIIHDNASVAESSGHAQSVFDYDHKSQGSKDYTQAAQELIKRCEGWGATFRKAIEKITHLEVTS